MARPFTLGAVAYDAKVVDIWEGFKNYFDSRELPFDFILFSNYETQVAAHFAGIVDAAWNSPLAWLQSLEIAQNKGITAEAIAMRDSDRDLKSLVVLRNDSDIESVADLKGKRIAVGAKDSPQATLIPLELMAEHSLIAGKDFYAEYFDILVGKHGDHIGGERAAARALAQGKVDAACMIDSNYSLFCREGTLNPSAVRSVAQTALYDHCNFTVLRERRHSGTEKFASLLLAMDYRDPTVRPLLDMEGLKKWVPGRISNYSSLAAAIRRFGTIENFVRETSAKT